MKLTRCYIENFGKLHQFKLRFSDGITTINQPNGFGKTTLTAFIKAMLYGLPKNNLPLEKNDRKRYTPWQGGIYGGYLEFEHNTIVYRIERTFGQTPKQDQYKLFRLNPFGPSKDFSENIGFEILGVSSEHFDQTTYMPQIRWNTVATSKDLKEKISAMTESALDIGSYEKAMKTLKNQRSELLPYRGKSGLLYKLSSEISETERSLNQCANAKTKLHEATDKLKENEHEIQKRKTARENIRKEIIAHSSSPSQNLLSARYAALNSQMQKIQKELDSFDAKYPWGLPSDAELQACSKHSEQFAAADSFIYNSAELYALSNDPPDRETIDSYDLASQELGELKHHLDSVYDGLDRTKPSVIFPILHCMMSILLFGITYALFQYTFPITWKIVLSVLSVCSATALFVSTFRNLKKRNKVKALETTVKQYNQRIYTLEQYLRNEMETYDLREDDPIHSLEILKESMGQYRALDHVRKKCQFEIRKILNQYRLFDYPETPETIHLLFEEKNAQKHLLEQERTLQKQIESLNQYCFADGNRTDHPSILSKKEQDLETQIDALQNDIVSLHKEIALLQQKSDSYMVLEDSLRSLKAQRTEAEKQVSRIDKAIQHLHAAAESLSQSVIEPLKEKFAEYVSALLEIPVENIFINEDISVSVEHSGVQRDQVYLSIGELDILALCMRLAILDILYPNQKPPLILDDPFVNLDAQNIKKVLNVLSQISKSHQIIYLTCHESRI